MIAAYFLIDAAGWTWIIVIAVLLVGGYFFIDRLMRKGIYEGRAGGGMMGRMGSAHLHRGACGFRGGGAGSSVCAGSARGEGFANGSVESGVEEMFSRELT